MSLPTLYPPQVGSPYTTLAAAYTTGAATMTLTDATKLKNAPNIVCLSGSVAGEFSYTGKDGNILQGVVALPGTPSTTWAAGTYAFRGIAAYDFSALQTRAHDAATPELRNRILRIMDAAGNNLEIHQVWIPKFLSEGFSQANLNGLLCGGFWIDKYQSCQPDASNVSRGSTSPNSPGNVGAACRPGVVVWTDIDWYHAKTAIENRGGAANRATGTCAVYGGGSTSEFYTADAAHLIGRRVRITQGGVEYVRRIVQTGGNVDADASAAKYCQVYPALPTAITASDTYEIVRHFLPGGYEWFSLAAWAMKYRYQYGLGYPLGNNNWGKDASDPRSALYEGEPDPVRPGYSGNAIARCLAGTGPVSWSLNGKESGVWDLNGNVWEWGDLLVGSAANNTIDARYPGAGHVLPTTSGYISSLYAPAPDGERSLAAEVFAPATLGSATAEFGSGRYYQSAGLRAALRGADWGSGVGAGLFGLGLGSAPSITSASFGLRGVC